MNQKAKINLHMRIVVNLDVMMAKRKISMTEISELNGVSMASLSLLKTGKARGVRFKTMEKIFTAYNCDFNDIFEVVSDEKYRELFGETEEVEKELEEF